MNRAILSIIGLSAMLALAGCETVKGIGRDITNTSDAVQQTFSKKESKGSWGGLGK
jgi:predicted small secreted protein